MTYFTLFLFGLVFTFPSQYASLCRKKHGARPPKTIAKHAPFLSKTLNLSSLSRLTTPVRQLFYGIYSQLPQVYPVPLKAMLWATVVLCTGVICVPHARAASAAETRNAPVVIPQAATPHHLLQPVAKAKAQTLALQRNKSQQSLASWTELERPLKNSLAYSQRWPQKALAIRHSGLRITWGEITASLLLLQKLLPRLDDNPQLFAEHFQWIHITPQTRFTSYYSPVIAASKKATAAFPVPLYRLPEELAPHLAHCLPTHTCPEETFTTIIKPDPPYHTRAAIDADGVLRGRGLEMAYVAHPFDAYLLMLQGSGVLQFPDGKQQAVLFAGLNGWHGQSMAGYLIKTGQLARKDADIHGMRAWWDNANAAQQRAFLEAAQGYVFFRFGAQTPMGTIGHPLTPWVSMAVDMDVIPLGAIIAYDLPVPQMPVHGIGFAHDTGNAIKMQRIDLYAGTGMGARKKAMQVYTKGHIWLLLTKGKK